MRKFKITLLRKPGATQKKAVIEIEAISFVASSQEVTFSDEAGKKTAYFSGVESVESVP